MKVCRFNGERLGLVQGDQVIDVSSLLDSLPAYRWARPGGDPVIARLDELLAQAGALGADAPRLNLADVVLHAPVACPSKIIGAPVNYHAHLDEARADLDLHQGRVVHPIDEIGCFLKANSALCGDGATISRPFKDKRIDHEAEVAVIISKPAFKVDASSALNFVAGYALALDMTVRGKQERSMRKSCDGFAVLGPWLVTADEVPDPTAIEFSLTVNGEQRQQASTAMLIRSVAELIEMCSAYYTLMPGDIIMTGTPSGVGPVAAGDAIEVQSPLLGKLRVNIS